MYWTFFFFFLSFLLRKLRDVLQQRVIRFFLDQSKKEPEKYARFFDDYGLFMREGIVTTSEQDVKASMARCSDVSWHPVIRMTRPHFFFIVLKIWSCASHNFSTAFV